MLPLWYDREPGDTPAGLQEAGQVGFGGRPGKRPIRSRLDLVLLVGLLAGLALVLVLGWVWWTMPFNGDVGPGPRFFAIVFWALAGTYAAAVVCWWRRDLRTPLLLASTPFIFFGLQGGLAMAVGLGHHEPVNLPIAAVSLAAGTAGFIAGYKGLSEHPRDQMAAVLIPGMAALALATGAGGVSWADGAFLLGAVAVANLLIPRMAAGSRP